MGKKVKKIIFFVLIIIFILIILTGGFIYVFIRNKMNKINYEQLNFEDLSINENILEEINSNEEISLNESELKQIKTIAIFGSDSRNVQDSYDDARSDVIIIFSVNQITKKISMISIPRDTYVNIDGHGKTKINHAFAYGKEQLAIKTINQNFGLNISEYITVNWESVAKLVNMVGGIDLYISDAEKNFINSAIGYTAENSNGNSTKLKSAGMVRLNGTQALTHCRNRKVGNDFKRAERQRNVITKLLEKISQKDLNEINTLIDNFLPYVKTNIDIMEYSSYIPEALKYKTEYLSNIVSTQVPSTSEAQGQMINGVYFFVPNSYEVCKQTFIEYLYGDKK
ncbi:MAG: LCP family protein [Clostridia bacterium]|nr:LCP family protein [Clostridia bacterium]